VTPGRRGTMRWVLAGLWLAVAFPVGAQQNEAEKLLRGMEKQVREAKGLQVGFEVDAKLPKGGGTLKGVLIVMEGNKVRFDAKGTFEGKDRTMHMVADGKQSAYWEDDQKPAAQAVEPLLSQALTLLLARGGVFAMFETSPDKGAFDIEKVLPA